MSTGRGTPSDYDWEDGADAPDVSDPSARTPAAPAALPALPRRGARAVPSRDLTADVPAWAAGAEADATGAASAAPPGVPHGARAQRGSGGPERLCRRRGSIETHHGGSDARRGRRCPGRSLWTQAVPAAIRSPPTIAP